MRGQNAIRLYVCKRSLLGSYVVLVGLHSYRSRIDLSMPLRSNYVSHLATPTLYPTPSHPILHSIPLAPIATPDTYPLRHPIPPFFLDVIAFI